MYVDYCDDVHCVVAVKKGVLPEKPSHAVIWVAKTYPPWQSLVLTTLKKLYEVK